MRRSQRFPRRALLAPLLALLFVGTSGCSLFWFVSLERDRELVRGGIQGRVVRADDDNAPASFAQVKLPGSARAVRADATGAFVVRDLLAGSWPVRIVDDPDGDGWPDRARAQGVLVPLVQHYASPIDQVAQNGTLATAGVDLGDVPLEKTGVISGRVFAGSDGVTPDAAGLIGRVVITRSLEVEFDLEGNTRPFDLGAEVVEGVDGDGRWRATGVGGGQVKVVPLLYEKVPGQPGALGPLVAVGEAMGFLVTSVGSFEEAPEEVGDIVVPPPFVEVDATASVAIELTPAVSGDTYVMFVKAGSPFPPCESSCVPLETCDVNVDALYMSNYPTLRTTPAQPPSSTLNVQAPLGAWDLRVCSGEQFGSLRGQVLTAPVMDSDVPVWGPVGLGAEDVACQSYVVDDGASCTIDSDCPEGNRCLPTGERTGPLGFGGVELVCHEPLADDCDGDLISGLPAYEPALDEMFAVCAAVCGDLRGSELDGATCVLDEGVFDCDDDGDGQADGQERSCYGRSGDDPGTDLDRDGVCSSLDAYPLCNANTAAACVAGTNDAASSATFEVSLGLDDAFGEGGRILVGDGAETSAVTSAAFHPSGTLFLGGFVMGEEPMPAVWGVDVEGGTVERYALSGNVSVGEVHNLLVAPVGDIDELILVGSSPMRPDGSRGASLPTVWKLELVGEEPLTAPLAELQLGASDAYVQGWTVASGRAVQAMYDAEVDEVFVLTSLTATNADATESRGAVWRLNGSSDGTNIDPVPPHGDGRDSTLAAVAFIPGALAVLAGSREDGTLNDVDHPTFWMATADSDGQFTEITEVDAVGAYSDVTLASVAGGLHVFAVGNATELQTGAGSHSGPFFYRGELVDGVLTNDGLADLQGPNSPNDLVHSVQFEGSSGGVLHYLAAGETPSGDGRDLRLWRTREDAAVVAGNSVAEDETALGASTTGESGQKLVRSPSGALYAVGTTYDFADPFANANTQGMVWRVVSTLELDDELPVPSGDAGVTQDGPDAGLVAEGCGVAPSLCGENPSCEAPLVDACDVTAVPPACTCAPAPCGQEVAVGGPFQLSDLVAHPTLSCVLGSIEDNVAAGSVPLTSFASEIVLVTGRVSIVNQSVIDLAFPVLAEIQADLEIRDNTSLQTLDLGELTLLGGGLVENNPSLCTSDLLTLALREPTLSLINNGCGAGVCGDVADPADCLEPLAYCTDVTGAGVCAPGGG